jgi:hypothetical protein
VRAVVGDMRALGYRRMAAEAGEETARSEEM